MIQNIKIYNYSYNEFINKNNTSISNISTSTSLSNSYECFDKNNIYYIDKINILEYCF